MSLLRIGSRLADADQPGFIDTGPEKPAL